MTPDPSRSTCPGPTSRPASQVSRAAAILETAVNPVVLAGHGATRSGAGPALRRFAEALGVSVATTFHGKGVFPDDHPQALGRHRIHAPRLRQLRLRSGRRRSSPSATSSRSSIRCASIPRGDKEIIHIHRFPAEVDRHYNVSVGLQADIGWSLDALAAAVDRRFEPPAGGLSIRGLLAEELERGRADDRFPLAPARIVADTREALGRGRHRAGGHRGAQDVDGPALSHLCAQYLSDLERALDHGVDRARGHRRQVGPAG